MDRFRRGDLVFDVVDGGPPGGAPVLLLHGFPQTAAMWAALAARLHEGGCRTVAPNQRGYSPGARPGRRRDYRLTELVDDAAALVDELGAGPVHVVGHDWGGAVAWMLSAWYPQHVRTLTGVAGPHLGAFFLSATRSRQALASWYIPCLQVPGAAERVLDPSTPAGRRRFVRFLTHFGARRADAERDADALGGREALRGGLLWYRALPLLPVRRLFRSTVAVPTLIVGGDGDTAVLPTGLELSCRYVTGPARLEILTGVSHWIPDQAPDRLADLILAHVAGPAVAPRTAGPPGGGATGTSGSPVTPVDRAGP